MNVSQRALLEHVVDYAGLFPPATLSMRDAVSRYAMYRTGPQSWMLGRFVLPGARLAEFAEASERVLDSASPWKLAAIVPATNDAGLSAIAAFNASHRGAICDAIETNAASPDDVERIARAIKTIGVAAFVEISIADDPDAIVASIGAQRLCAKARTGGTTHDAFPVPGDVVRFLRACVRHAVPFKVTAGLHHALRGEYPLTYEPASVAGTMFGFLNVMLAAALLRDGASDEAAERALTETDAGALSAETDTLSWRDATFVRARLEQLRARGFTSFGSCSFTEPVDELRALQWL